MSAIGAYRIRNIFMIAQPKPIDTSDLVIVRKLQAARDTGYLQDDDRVVFFAPEEPVGLFSAFGHGADDRTFNGIVTADFRGLNPGLAAV